MSLQSWLTNGWLIKHQTSSGEIADLFTVAARDLADCSIEQLSSDHRAAIAYSAALQIATAALAAAGYRASRDNYHLRVSNSLAHTIGADSKLVSKLEAFRKKRNISVYERAGMVSNHEADEIKELAGELKEKVLAWLKTEHPQLLSEK